MLTKPPVPYALVGAFSVITNLRMELFEALICSRYLLSQVAGARMLPLLVPARRGKFSPGAVSAAPGDKEARRVVPVPCTQQQEAAEARLYDEGGCGDPGPREREGDGTISKMSNFSVEGFSRPVSPTTHLHKVKEYGKIFKNILTSL